MAIELKTLIEPATTAVLCMEMQRGVVGDLSPIPQLVAAVQARGITSRLAALFQSARTAGVQVVYCNALYRPDHKGSVANCAMLARSIKLGKMIEGTADVENLPELAPQAVDFVSGRYHGMSPFTGTALDSALRNMGIKTIVATGVSLNVGIVAMCAEALGLGYRVVVPRDGVVGVPVEFGDAVLQNSIPVMATVTTSDALRDAWQA